MNKTTGGQTQKSVQVMFSLHNLFPTQTNTLKARWYLICPTHTFTDSTVEQKKTVLCLHAKTTEKNPIILEDTSRHFSFQARLVAT